MKQFKWQYPIGSISSGTMRPEDLIPAFVSELERRLKNGPPVSRETRKAHTALMRDINTAMESEETPYFTSEDLDFDLDTLFDALNCYAAPYFYFGAHPGDGSDYGYWLQEDWQDGFVAPSGIQRWTATSCTTFVNDTDYKIVVADLSEVPAWFRGEVAVVNDHGNVTLYVKTSRTLREVWSIV